MRRRMKNVVACETDYYLTLLLFIPFVLSDFIIYSILYFFYIDMYTFITIIFAAQDSVQVFNFAVT